MSRILLSERLVFLWKTRLLVCSIPVALLDGFFFYLNRPYFYILTVFWTVLFVLFYFLYFPWLFQKMSYSLTQDTVSIKYGLLIQQQKTVHIKNIQYLTITQAPLERLFGLSTLSVMTAGSRLKLSGLPQDTSVRLMEKLCRSMEVKAYEE